MAAFETTRSLTDGRAIGAGVTRLFAYVLVSFAAWNDARITRKALRKLTLRQLDDLGLIPADIEDIAQGKFRR